VGWAHHNREMGSTESWVAFEDSQLSPPSSRNNIRASPDWHGHAAVPQADGNKDDTYHMSWKGQAPKALALCELLWPFAQHQVEFLAEGGYNKVIAASITDELGIITEFVIRIPRDTSSVLNSVGILRYLRRNTDIKVPDVIFFDGTSNNPLEYPFMVLQRLPGKNLEVAWEYLTQKQKLSVAREVGDFYLKLMSITSSVAGQLKATDKIAQDNINNLGPRITVHPFGVSTCEYPQVDYTDEDNGILPLDRLTRDPPYLSVDDMMLAPFKRRIYQADHSTPPDKYKIWDYQQCLDIVEDMLRMKLFETCKDTGFCLWHQDLWPRNIMVDFNSIPVITGILDWDTPIFAPKFVAATPPRWLWQHQEYTNTLDSDRLSYNNNIEPLDGVKIAPDSLENAEIERAFEDAVGEEWVRLAYQPEFVFARRIILMSQWDHWDRFQEAECNKTKALWDALIESRSQGPTAHEPSAFEASVGDGISTASDSSSEIVTVSPIPTDLKPSPQPEHRNVYRNVQNSRSRAYGRGDGPTSTVHSQEMSRCPVLRLLEAKPSTVAHILAGTVLSFVFWAVVLATAMAISPSLSNHHKVVLQFQGQWFRQLQYLLAG
jgi:hypothetical protein